jgi:hypothetical protein
MDVLFYVDISITDKNALIEHSKTFEMLDDDDPIAEHIREALFNPTRPPVDVGFEYLAVEDEVVRLQSTKDGDERYRVSVHCNVHDVEALVAESLQEYVRCWDDKSWFPETVEEALYEVILASNANPSPVEVGFEIRDSVYLTTNKIDPLTVDGANDMWDNSGADFLFQFLPPNTVDQAMRGTNLDMIKITFENGDYWVNNERDSGEEIYSTLSEAKKAGLDIIDRANSDMQNALRTDSGLDETWSFNESDCAFLKEGADSAMICEGNEGKFVLWMGDNMMGEFNTVGEAGRAVSSLSSKP